MKKNKYILIVCAFAATLFCTNCANSDDLTAPTPTFHEATANITLDGLYNKATDSVQLYTEDDILEAYVTSSDEGGSFYKSISFQDEKGTKGFSIAVDMYNTSTYISPGRKVYVYLKDLHFSIAHGSLVIGALHEGTVGRIRPQDFYKKVLPSNIKVDETSLMKTLTLAQLKNNNNINTLVEIKDIHFDPAVFGKSFYDETNAIGGATNINLLDATGSVIFRTSEFAKFANETIPKKLGTVRGVLTKFNNDFQLMARTFNDLQFTTEYKTAIGGESMAFKSSIMESFESFEVGTNATTFPIYGNDYSTGGKYWAVKLFQNNKYIQLTAFNNNAAITKSYFIMPVKFNGSNSMSFETKDGYFNGNVLHVYYTTAANYTYGGTIKAETFTNITTNFTYSTGNTNGYAQNFVPSGNFQFPTSATGDGYIIFEYSGTPALTTTIQIDNIKFQ